MTEWINPISILLGVPTSHLWLILGLVLACSTGLALMIATGNLLFGLVGSGAVLFFLATKGVLPIWSIFIMFGITLGYAIWRLIPEYTQPTTPPTEINKKTDKLNEVNKTKEKTFFGD